MKNDIALCKQKDKQGQPQASEQAAKLTGTNRQYVADAKSIQEKAPDVAEAVKSGAIKIYEAKRVATLPECQRKVVIEKVQSGEKPSQAIHEAKQDNTDIISNDHKRNESHGTSIEYTLRRLRKDHPETHQYRHHIVWHELCLTQFGMVFAETTKPAMRHGANRFTVDKEDRDYNYNVYKHQGTSAEYLTSVIARDRPDVHAVID